MASGSDLKLANCLSNDYPLMMESRGSAAFRNLSTDLDLCLRYKNVKFGTLLGAAGKADGGVLITIFKLAASSIIRIYRKIKTVALSDSPSCRLYEAVDDERAENVRLSICDGALEAPRSVSWSPTQHRGDHENSQLMRKITK